MEGRVSYRRDSQETGRMRDGGRGEKETEIGRMRDGGRERKRQRQGE